LQNPDGFFASVDATLFGVLTRAQIDGMRCMLAAGAGVLPLTWMAYVLATAYHETGMTMQPVHEKGMGDRDHNGVDDWFEKYGRGQKAKDLGNLSLADGGLFHGRGFPQLTGRANYRRATVELHKLGILKADEDLERTPDLALRLDIAVAIMIYGMRDGWFTGRGLRRYLFNPATAQQYVNARYVVNGTDKATKIAGHALHFEAALKAGSWL
jgi:putative chitinase